MTMSGVSSIITGTGLGKTYQSGFFSHQKTFAVQDVDIEIKTGETYALVGESGSGKTTLGKILLKLISPTSGRIFYHNEDITDLQGPELIPIRRKMQIIPQHPEDAFNPRWRLSRSIMEPFLIHGQARENGGLKNVLLELLAETGLNPDYAERYPHQLSGGELQRAAIARALALKPDFILCDEPTSMLDVSVQAAIIQLLLSLQKRSTISLLFITHDLKLADHIADRVGVMYNGHIIEEGSGILKSPMHPYSQSIVRGHKHQRPDQSIPSHESCPFVLQCPNKTEKCQTIPSVTDCSGRKIRCHHPFKYD